MYEGPLRSQNRGRLMEDPHVTHDAVAMKRPQLYTTTNDSESAKERCVMNTEKKAGIGRRKQTGNTQSINHTHVLPSTRHGMTHHADC